MRQAVSRAATTAQKLNSKPSAWLAGSCFPRQLLDPVSSTFTYLLADPDSRDAVLFDPVLEQAERDAGLVRELGLHLRLVLNTHCHADHVTGSGALKAEFGGLKSGISASSGCQADILLMPGQKVWFGSSSLLVLSTPGHTNGCISFYSSAYGGSVYTGDALLIRGCGRTDFQNGNSRQLHRSVHSQLFTLPPQTRVYPAHDYNGRTLSTIGEEIAFNPRMNLSETEFEDFMKNLNLPFPKMLDQAVPANLACGA